jgi:hypothetical protein
VRLLGRNVRAKTNCQLDVKATAPEFAFIVDEGLYHNLCEAIDLMWKAYLIRGDAE